MNTDSLPFTSSLVPAARPLALQPAGEQHVLAFHLESSPPSPMDNAPANPPQLPSESIDVIPGRNPPSLLPRQEYVRWRSRIRFRRRRMRRAMGRPPLRELPFRKPTREEFLANALAALWEQGTPNRNLVRLVRWFYGDLGESIIPGNIRRKHHPAASEVIRKTEEDLSSLFRRDSISCRRMLRRGRTLERNKNYRWTRFPAAGLDNFGRSAVESCPAYNPFLGLEIIHPRLVGFATAEGFPERLRIVRRIVGLENVFSPEEIQNGLSNGLSDGLRNCLKNASQLPPLRPLRRGFVFPVHAVRRRFVLPPSAAGPPGVIVFPPGGEREVLLCLPDGGLRVVALCPLCPRMRLRAS